MAEETKKYLDYEQLGYFKQRQDALNDEKDAKVLSDAKTYAKEYADGLADNYDAAGTAQTKVDELANGAVKDNTDAIATLNGDATTEGSVAKTVKDAKDLVDADIQGLSDKIGDIAEGETVASLIAKNAEDIQGHKDAVDGVVTTLVGQDTNKSVRTIANEELAAQLLSGKAEADFKTLQELAAWLEEHPEEVADINLNIQNLQTLVGALPEGATATDVVGYIAELVTAEKSRAEGIESGLDERLQAVEEAVGEGGSVDAQIDAKIAELDADVTSAEVEEGKGLRVQVVEVDGKVTNVAVTGNYDNAYDAKGAADTAEANAKAEVTALADGAVKTNTEAIASINNEETGILAQAKSYADSKDTAMDARVDVVEEAIGENGSVTNAIADAKKAGTDAADAVSALETGAVKDNADAIAELESKVGAGYEAITKEQIDALFVTAEA